MLYSDLKTLIAGVRERFDIWPKTEDEAIQVFIDNGFKPDCRDGFYSFFREWENEFHMSGNESYTVQITLEKFVSEIDKLVDILIKNPKANNENIRMFKHFSSQESLNSLYKFEISKFEDFRISFNYKDSEFLFLVSKELNLGVHSISFSSSFQLGLERETLNNFIFRYVWYKIYDYYDKYSEPVKVSDGFQIIKYMEKMQSLQAYMYREDNPDFLGYDPIYVISEFEEINKIVDSCSVLGEK